jgi:hypothetical protein
MVVAIGELSQQAAGNIPRRDLKSQLFNPFYPVNPVHPSELLPG